MNAAIRAVVRTALCKNMRVLGVRHGYSGLLSRDVQEMDLRSVSDILHRGGTVLGTARCLAFREIQAWRRAAALAKSLAWTA
jgi:6-phosphofructokinase 1